ncbi:MAG: hypothetical protein IPK53_05900 [bacterium]|nr:hypothetical protein [bacterium]MBK8128487.1 hypothetical protein [bacterium]
MNAFVTGLLIGFVASIPALVLAWFKTRSGMDNFVRLWGLGVALRFVLIGAGLFWQMRQPDVAKVPLVLGIVLAFYLSLAIEFLIARVANK